MPYFIILPVFALYLLGMCVALVVASVVRPAAWLRPYLTSVLLWSSVGFVVTAILYFLVLVAAVNLMDVTFNGQPSTAGGVAMGGLVFVAPFVAAVAGTVGGAAFGVWRRSLSLRRAG